MLLILGQVANMDLLEEQNTMEVESMTNQQTLDRLHQMRLSGMADSLTTQLSDFKNLMFASDILTHALKILISLGPTEECFL